MILYDMTWPEVAQLSKETVVVVPFGAVEQHSNHLPLGTDSLIADAIARRLEKAIPDQTLILPTTWLGCSRHHMDFPGSLTAEIDTFISAGEQVVESMAHHGFRKFLLLNAHGGNISKVAIMVEKLQHRLGPDCKIVGITYWDLITREIRTIRETPLGGMGHACELETSLVLAESPQAVRKDRMEPDGPDHVSQFEEQDMFAPGKVTVIKPLKEISRHGGVGDPRSAAPQKGEQIFAAVISKLTQVVEEIQTGAL